MDPNKEIPVIKTFIHNEQYYVYDASTNEMLKILKDDFIKINELKRDGRVAYMNRHLNDPQDHVIHLMKQGYFKAEFIQTIENPYNGDFEDLLKRSIDDITLQITQECNFKCRYCSFSINNNIGRTHKKVHMEWDIAQKSIDFFMKHSANSDIVTVSFYGGEPLLNFELIKKVVLYSLKVFNSKTVRFVTTVNGSLLTDEIVDFIAKHNFLLSISLDGPRSIQNRHRLYLNSGGGTFDVVYNNILRFRKRYPQYFKEHIFFLPVLFENESKTDVIDFFEHNLNIDVNHLNIHTADMSGIDYMFSRPMVTSKENDGGNNKYAIDGDLERLLLNSYNDKKNIEGEWHHKGPCIPGVNRLFVDVNGVLYPCEKCVDNKFLSIGDIFDGFDLKKIYDYMNIGKLTENECKHCWAMRFCDICALRCLNIDTNSFCKNTKLKSCAYEKNKTLIFLRNLINERDR